MKFTFSIETGNEDYTHAYRGPLNVADLMHSIEWRIRDGHRYGNIRDQKTGELIGSWILQFADDSEDLHVTHSYPSAYSVVYYINRGNEYIGKVDVWDNGDAPTAWDVNGWKVQDKGLAREMISLALAEDQGRDL